MISSGLGGLAASIRALFANGEQRAWYDPSDTSTLYQDSAGTTPVTAVEQPVGLMLDKRNGPTLGSEIAPNNGTFSSSTGWDTGAGTTITGGFAVSTNVASGTATTVAAGIGSANKWYKVTITVSSFTSGALRPVLFGNVLSSNLISSTGTFTFIVFSSSGDMYLQGFGGATPTTITLSAFSAKELPGNHAYQFTSANRPTLSARYNLLTATETFSNTSFWSGAANYTFSSTDAPDGSNTATRITTTSSASVFTQEVSATSTSYVHVVYLRAGTYAPVATIRNNTTATNLIAATAGSIGSFSNSYGTWVVSDAGNGWRKCVLTVTSGITVGNSLNIYLGYSSYPGAGFYMDAWHPDFRASNDVYGIIPAYQRVTTSTDYDTVGFPPYLRFNGSSSAMLTNSVDFSGTDKMTVWSGVRKLSDAGLAYLCSLSTDVTTTAGTFWLLAPDSAAPTYNWRSRGSINAASAFISGYAAPITNVVTGIGAIATDTSLLRVNGAQVASTTSDQGTGNFGNYPLYLGSNSTGGTNSFNGRLYGLVVRGAQSNAAQIERGETYMNVKIGKVY